MRSLQSALVDTRAARDRCLQYGLKHPLRLDRAIFLDVLARFVSEDPQPNHDLYGYAQFAVDEPLSCLASPIPGDRSVKTMTEQKLSEAVAALSPIGGVVGLIGLLFSIETINFGEEVEAVLNAPLVGDVQAPMLSELLRCLGSVEDDGNGWDLFSASAHHCYDLVAALQDHEHRIGIGLGERRVPEGPL